MVGQFHSLSPAGQSQNQSGIRNSKCPVDCNWLDCCYLSSRNKSRRNHLHERKCVYLWIGLLETIGGTSSPIHHHEPILPRVWNNLPYREPDHLVLFWNPWGIVHSPGNSRTSCAGKYSYSIHPSSLYALQAREHLPLPLHLWYAFGQRCVHGEYQWNSRAVNTWFLHPLLSSARKPKNSLYHYKEWCCATLIIYV